MYVCMYVRESFDPTIYVLHSPAYFLPSIQAKGLFFNFDCCPSGLRGGGEAEGEEDRAAGGESLVALEACLDKASKGGGWVIIQNIHLATTAGLAWLQRRLEMLAETAEPG